jgi:pyruvate dehydrogenase E1 component beta subunit
MMSATRQLTMAQAISEGIAQEMTRDAKVFVMGEDIGAYGGIFGATGGLLEKFGKDRVMDTPISETAFIGTATGAAAAGLRPIVELMFVDFPPGALANGWPPGRLTRCRFRG